MHATGIILVLAILMLIAATAGAQVKIEKVPFFNHPNCYKLSNGTVEVIVTSDIGPRVIAYRFPGGENMLAELPEAAVSTAFGDWHPYGGHRLWAAPEVMPRTYYPDNSPITAEPGKDSIRLIEPTEPPTGIQKEMLITLDATGTRVTILHKLTNKGIWPIELAPWALTIVNGGGTTIIPNEPFVSHDDKLTPARSMTLWGYTDFSDPRWTFGKKYTRLHTDPKLEDPQKAGFGDKLGWAGYLRKDILFVKTFPYTEGKEYPDNGCNFETYTAGTFMEVETLGPMVKLEPEQSVTHVEQWYLFKDVKPGDTEESLDAAIKPLIERIRK
ncbi:MAG TPA: hypothetical protein VFI02_04320 [Armatimonadota bacterium]|nr:hypothetical protein [Armatimonadota bacterium]